MLLFGFHYKKKCVGLFIVCLLSFISPAKIESCEKFLRGCRIIIFVQRNEINVTGVAFLQANLNVITLKVCVQC